MSNYNIAVAGTGYVGLSLAVLLAQHNTVTAVDIIESKVDLINQRKSPIQDEYIAGFVFHKKTSAENNRLANMQKALNAKSWIKYIIVVASIAVFSFALMFYNQDCYIYTTKISIIDAENAITQVGIDIFRWAIGFVGSILVVMLCVLVYKAFHEKKFASAVIRAVVKLGQMSIGIYILNYYTNGYLLPYIMKNASPNLALWILVTAISLLLYSAVVYCIRKIPLLNRLFLGGR